MWLAFHLSILNKPAYQRISHLSHPKYRFFQHQVCNIFPTDSVNIFVYCGKVIFTEYYVYYPNITPLWLHLDNNSVGIAIVILLKCDLSENRVWIYDLCNCLENESDTEDLAEISNQNVLMLTISTIDQYLSILFEESEVWQLGEFHYSVMADFDNDKGKIGLDYCKPVFNHISHIHHTFTSSLIKEEVHHNWF